jgi:hypothetical protein
MVEDGDGELGSAALVGDRPGLHMVHGRTAIPLRLELEAWNKN